jgi:cardiolipin synthase
MKPAFLPGNRLGLLNSGHEYFPALVAEIDGARSEIFLETYIFADDPTGRTVAAALGRAARRGVAVRVLVDGFGGGDFADTLMPGLVREGVRVMIYRPEIARFRLRRHRLRRLHRKLVVIDRRIGFVGGINVIDDLNTPHQIPPRFDYAVRVEGPVVQPMLRAMQKLWEIVVWANFKRRHRLAHFDRAPEAEFEDGKLAAFVLRDNIRRRRDIEDAYLDAIHGARQEVVIACAYFLPGRRFRNALIDAARRGIQVTVLLQGRVEYRLLHYAQQAIYQRLLSVGIRVFEYHRSFLHAKVAVVDGEWATVGSSNIDPFSLLLAKEANLVVLDREFAGLLHASLQEAMTDSARELRARGWRQRNWLTRLMVWASYQLTRLVIDVTGYGRHL